MKQVVLGVISLNLIFAASILEDAYAQEKEYPAPPFEKRTCPVETDREQRGVVDSLYQVPYCWKRGEGLAGGVEILDSLKIKEDQHSYLFKIWPMGNGVIKDPENRFILSVERKNKVYYHTLPIRHSSGYNKVKLRSLRTVDVPEAKREYLWPEFYEATPDRESDTTYVGWLAYVHTFHPGDQPSLQPRDAFVPISSADSRASNRDTITRSSIPIRTWDVVDEQKTKISQIDVRFTGPKTIEVTPRTDSLTSGHRAWLGTFRLRSWEKLKD